MAVDTGQDPAGEKAVVRSEKRAPDFAAVVEEFHRRHSDKNRTGEQTRQMFAADVTPRWQDRSVDEISRRDVIALVDHIVDRGAPVRANRIFANVRRFFSWCLERDLIEVSPCAGVRPPTKERSRDRVIDDDELAAVWSACDGLSPTMAGFIRLLILTGQRRGEVAGMAWSELDLEHGMWTLSGDRVKNAVPHEVPLAQPAIDVLASMPRMGPLVFTTTGHSPISGFSKLQTQLRAVTPDGEPWVLHDLRRTAASGMARLGHPVHVVEAVLNHLSGTRSGVAGVYNRHRYTEEKRAALEDWATHVVQVRRMR
ncbi:MAG: tyrosine-type recombinase/integrase [Devosia sp.]